MSPCVWCKLPKNTLHTCGVCAFQSKNALFTVKHNMIRRLWQQFDTWTVFNKHSDRFARKFVPAQLLLRSARASHTVCSLLYALCVNLLKVRWIEKKHIDCKRAVDDKLHTHHSNKDIFLPPSTLLWKFRVCTLQLWAIINASCNTFYTQHYLA